MKHRSEIDGLRALAVMPIVLFHAGLAHMPSGFVGVDVFFVVSGYLITTIISGEMATGTFGLANFYRRRAVRILPALFAMLAATLLAATILLLPFEIRHLALGAAAATGFVSNIYLWETTQYFGLGSDANILLHTWSLGVEEQFYLVFPLLLLALRRWGDRRIVTIGIVLVTAASFVISLATSSVSGDDFGFYMLPSRAWELGLGGALALWAIPSWPPILRELGAATGVVLIAVATVVIPADHGFPAPWALVPCLGALLVLAFGSGSRAGAVLSIWPLRWIGRISYSLYLWHWPIITFFRLRYGFFLSHTDTLALTVASLVAATGSYWLIERPFLDRYRSSPPRRVFAVAMAAILLLFGLCALVFARAERWHAVPPAVLKISSYTDYYAGPAFTAQFAYGRCFVEPNGKLDRASCVRHDTARRNVLLVGDSTAAHLSAALRARGGERVALSQVTAGVCRPTHTTGRDPCAQLMRWVFTDIVTRQRPDQMILGGLWDPADLPRLLDIIRFLRARGIAVVVLGPQLQYSSSLPTLTAHAMLRGDIGSVDRYRLSDRKPLSDSMAAPVRAAGARYIPVYDLQCPTMPCNPIDPSGAPILFDTDHMTPQAAARVAAAIPLF